MNAKEKLLRIGMPVGAILASISIGFAGITSAQTATNSTISGTSSLQERGFGMRGERPAVFGKVTAISGTTITVDDQKPGDTTVTTFTVDASNAKIIKGSGSTQPTESSITAIAIGDVVAIRGTVNGTSVTATEIMDGPHGMFGMHGGPGMGRGHGTQGTVTAVNGNTITISGQNGTTYTVDASSAHIGKITTISADQIAVGDSLDVMGEVSGTTVTAKHIMDGIPQNPQQ